MAATCNAAAPDPLHALSNGFTDDSADAQVNGAKADESLKNGHLCNGTDPVHREDNWIPIREEVLWKPTRKLRVVSIGAGFSGITLANKMQRTYKLEDFIEHVIYEKNPDIGGTWYENRYPGVMCDVPAHIYTLLDIPNPDWNAFYATGGEIQEYLKKICAQYDLDKNVRLESKVISAIWEEETGMWALKVQQKDKIVEDRCHVLINGSGVLNAWSWPDIPGLREFQGHLCHSADFGSGLDFAGKQVAVLGNGSSGIQIVPEMQKVASKVVNFARSKTWISAPFVEDLSKSPGRNPEYTQEEKDWFRTHPEELKVYRKKLAHAFNHFYDALIEGSAAHVEATRRTKELMSERLKGRADILEAVVPDWALGCRRLTPGNGYLEALMQDNTEFVTDRVIEITPTGITTSDNKHRQFDAIILATGFDVSFRPRWTQIGRRGQSLADEWKDDPRGYFSLAVSGYPNHFIFNGPAGPVGHGSLSSAIDWTADYIIKWLTKMAKEDIKSIDVKPEVQDDWNVWGDELMKRTVWASGCRSWYKNGQVDGRITALYPGSILHYKDMIENIRGEDFDITYHSKNRWRFLGNGFTQMEVDGGDLSYYLQC